MTTVADLINDVRTRMSGTLTDGLNRLATGYSPGNDTIVLQYPVQITPGSIVCSGENTWYVAAVDSTASTTLKVIPQYDGGPDVAKASGAIVRIKPRVTDWSIFTLIRDQIALMGAPGNGLGRFDFWMDQGLADTGQYAPPDGVTPARIVSVYGSDGTKWWPVTDYRLQLGSVRVWNDRWSQYCFAYVEPFKEVTAFTQDVETDIGLSSAMVDIPVLGAAGMLLLTQENRRGNLDAQGDPRRSNEIVAGTNMGAGREMIRQRDRRIAEEYGRVLNLGNLWAQRG